VEFIFKYGLFAVMVSLLLAPFGLSVPEEGSILAAGALVELGATTLPKAYAVSYVGVLCADSILYAMGHLLGLESESLLGRLLGAKNRERIEKFYGRFGIWTIVLCRPAPGVRSATFFFAGASGVPYRRFLSINAITANFAVAFYLYLGVQVGEHFEDILDFIKRFQQVFGVAIACLACYLIWRKFSKGQNRS